MGQSFTALNLRFPYFLEASKDALRNSFIAFSISKEALRARVPAALLPFSDLSICIFVRTAAYKVCNFFN